MCGWYFSFSLCPNNTDVCAVSNNYTTLCDTLTRPQIYDFIYPSPSFLFSSSLPVFLFLSPQCTSPKDKRRPPFAVAGGAGGGDGLSPECFIINIIINIKIISTKQQIHLIGRLAF